MKRDVYALNCVIVSLSIHTYLASVIYHDDFNFKIGTGIHFCFFKVLNVIIFLLILNASACYAGISIWRRGNYWILIGKNTFRIKLGSIISVYGA